MSFPYFLPFENAAVTVGQKFQFAGDAHRLQLNSRAQILEFKMVKSVQFHGFSILPGIVNSPAIDALIDAIDKADHDSSHRREHASYAMRNLLQRVPQVARFATSSAILRHVQAILGESAKPIRGLLFDKIPGANWKVFWHQDLVIPVKERVEIPGFRNWSKKDGVQHVEAPDSVLQNMLSVRIHLDDCGPDNGPLCVLPGSHAFGRLDAAAVEQCKKTMPTVECIALRGSIMLMRPLLLHASFPAKNPGHRRVIHLEYAGTALPLGMNWQVS